MKAIIEFSEEYPPENRINVSWIRIGPSTPYVGGEPVSLKKRSPTIKMRGRDRINVIQHAITRFFA
jgi:hypothetical protein